MNGKEGKGLYGAVGTIFVAGLLGGAIYLHEPAYHSSRPPPSGLLADVPVRAANQVPVLGWEDPFGPVHDHWRDREESGETGKLTGLGALKRQVGDLERSGALEHVLFVPVWNERTAVHEETRRRHRYAVYSALTERGDRGCRWLPEAENRVAYGFADFASPEETVAPLPIIYEWFRRFGQDCDAAAVNEAAGAGGNGDAEQTPYLLILWIPEDLLTRGQPPAPLATLARIARSLLGPPGPSRGEEQEEDASYSANLAMLGPPDSGFMQEMVLEREPATGPASRGRREIANPVLERLHVLSPLSTVPPCLLSDRLASAEESETLRLCKLQETKLDAKFAREILGVGRFSNFVARDDATIKLVLDELARRGVDVCDMAIVTESNSNYGLLFSNYIRHYCGGGEGRDETPFDLLEISLLRGIDGVADIRPGDPIQDGPERSSGGASGSGGGPAPGIAGGLLELPELEYPTGNSQYDYLRRLARGFASENRDMPGAIGVFGTDVYDKLLVLQAFRSSFRSSVFFTTDLDARLYDERDIEATRNLLVASAHGLTPIRKEGEHGGIRRHPPIFRYSYQTAIYKAVRGLVGGRSGAARQDEPSGTASDVAEPRLFEIGRRGPVDITFGKDGNPERTSEPADPGSLLRKGSVTFLTWGALAIPLLVSLGIESWRAFNLPGSKDGNSLSSPARSSRGVAVLMVIALAAYTVFFIIWYPSSRVEPWRLFDGVSTMPAFVLRAETILMAAAIAWVGWARIRYSNAQLERRYGFSAPENGGIGRPGDTGATGGPWNWFRQRSISGWGAEIRGREELEQAGITGDPTGVRSNELWQRYRQLGTAGNRLMRAAIPTIFAVLATAVVVYVIHPEPQLVRGELFRTINAAVYVASLTVGFYALFLSADALKLLRQLIRALGYSNIDWSDSKTTGTNEGYWDSLRPVELIERRTTLLGTVLYWPFVIMLMLMVSRSRLFEGWIWSPWIIVLYIVVTGYLVLHAGLVQREAGKTRERIVHRLKRRDVKGDEDADPEVDRRAMEYLESLDEGVFTPWQRHPLFQALLLPFGGAGSLALLQMLL